METARTNSEASMISIGDLYVAFSREDVSSKRKRLDLSEPKESICRIWFKASTQIELPHKQSWLKDQSLKIGRWVEGWVLEIAQRCTRPRQQKCWLTFLLIIQPTKQQLNQV